MTPPSVGGDGKNKAEVKSEPVASITPSSTSSVAGMADEGKEGQSFNFVCAIWPGENNRFSEHFKSHFAYS